MPTDHGIRGVRQSVTSGVVLGRLDSGAGPVTAISLADLTSQLLKTGKLAGASVKQEWQAGTVTAIDPRMTISAGTLDLVSSATQLRTIVFPLVGLPPGGQKYSVVMTQPGTLLANGGTPEAYIPTHPTATEDLTLNSIHASTTTTLGTITVNTGGTVTLPTFAAVSMGAGDVLQIVNQATADVTFADASFSFQYAVSEAIASTPTPEWSAGTVTAVGSGLTIAGATISATAAAQTRFAPLVNGQTPTAGIITDPSGQAIMVQTK